jgi:hypothetical protein
VGSRIDRSIPNRLPNFELKCRSASSSSALGSSRVASTSSATVRGGDFPVEDLERLIEEYFEEHF